MKCTTVVPFFGLMKTRRLGYILVIAAISISVINIGISYLDPNIHDASYQPLTFHNVPFWDVAVGTNHHQQQQYYYDTNINLDMSIDMISIGTNKRPEYQYAQQNTFIRHDSVRNFYHYNEDNDTDTTCHTNLTIQQFNLIHQFCTRRDEYQSKIAKLFGQERLNFKPINATGWLCAQKRPIDGLYLTLKQYLHHNNNNNDNNGNNMDGTTTGKSSSSSSIQSIQQTPRNRLPKYLILMDDDTYINMTFMTELLSHQYKYQEPYLLTGCLLQFNKYIMFQFPFGGYASIFTQKVIEHLIQPIYCHTTTSTSRHHRHNNNNNDPFNRRACSRLQENLIGELGYFQEGMSILELMYTFSSALQFTMIDDFNNNNNNNKKAWVNGTGFCFHSDHALGYFFGYYYVGVPDHVWNNPLLTTDNAKQRGYSYNILSKEFTTCNNKRWECGNSTTICHYNTPQQMHLLYQKELNNNNNSTLSG